MPRKKANPSTDQASGPGICPPLSSFSMRGFFGNNHFSKCNDYLKEHEVEPINWSRSFKDKEENQ